GRIGVVAALTLGDKSQLDKDTRNAFAMAGAMHVLAVSGLHVGILFMVIQKLLKPLSRLKNGSWFKTVILIATLWFYATLTGLSPSVLRTSTMFTFIALASHGGRQSNIYNTLAASAFLLLAIDPHLLFNVGFQLSYCAVIGIIWLQPVIYRVWFIKHKVGNWLWQLTSVSLAAQIATFPLGIFYFEQFPNLFLLTNILVIPAATALLICGLGFYASCWIPEVNQLVAWVVDKIAAGMNGGVCWVESIPFSSTQDLYISLGQMALIYAVIISLFLWFEHKKSACFKRFLVATIVAVICF
ncbi:MAG: ComEC/Rec2 family competence protein, partial [Flavobacteriales bacterium]|nr:ComEC/Rec2 family competence protein [Flavobacteriales bacterium]